ncbi:hypothetical protein BEL04_23460 [Mucilaginibacter sp. PPCGB 2223]|uniref:hypothetical protein n=1 Tax=Mucilaginibacter sp. PPCGB 2223 TaxID=1886027 RepID=UPI0008260C37|nr:hypothetical protein [Mucilaginibacter sp. PPCGB 2223]OCX50270.1 hypothetical protein BEL04_23460 [Mucilaginibacter sp. PPCGB 2223]
MKRFCNLFIFTIAAFCLSCKQPAKVEHPSFKSVIGIHYTEVRRTFKNGVIFNGQGFQLAPDWRFTFVSADSINIYSPEKKRFFNCPVIFDHDSVFNIAWAWLKLKKLTKDSIKFQVLHVENKVIIDDRSNLYMTVYSDDYIKNKLHTDAQTLQRPRRIDTLFIKAKIAQAVRNPDSSFAGAEQPVIKSKSPLLTIKRVEAPVDSAVSTDPKADYINPEYDITINKAYKDFNYSFVVIVDAAGAVHFWRSTIVPVDKDFETWQNRMMTGIVNGYLKLYLNVTPGKTLGLPHNSFVVLNVTGKSG